jgi:hypothetical protein
MLDHTEGETVGHLLFQIRLQKIARDGGNLQCAEIGDEVFANPITRRGGGGELPLAAAEGEKRVAYPIADRPDAGDGFSGMGVDGPEQFRHFGQSFGPAHAGARSQNLAATTAILPPERNPVPGATGLTFLQTATLEATSRERNSRAGNRLHIHFVRTLPLYFLVKCGVPPRFALVSSKAQTGD